MAYTPTQLKRRAQLLLRLKAADDARDDLLNYTRFTMPHPDDMDDVTRSLYEVAPLHRLLADQVMKLKSGEIRRLILTCPPRHGKTELCTRHFMAWLMGLFPEWHLMFGTYNDLFAEENGRAVREIVQGLPHLQVFPDFALKPQSASVKRLETSKGGVITFAGRDSTFTGRGGHGLILDDPIKNDEEADSKIIRDKLWNWFNRTVSSRLMHEGAFILIIQTRWHEDDLVGRLLDPTNPWYNEEEAKQWHLVELSALAGDHDILGRKPGEPLWPKRFGERFLLEQQRRDPRGFQALYQGKPTPDSGAFFTKDMLNTYQPDELPKNLRYYIASDHAVATGQRNDKTCLIPVGIDDRENVYVLNDVWWKKEDADIVVEGMLDLMKKYKPIYWWAERGHISKSIGPFLRKRMLEERVFVSVVQMPAIVDKQQRAQSIQGRMAMGKVFFPVNARWWPDAREQMIRFPNGANDDFVDALAHLGMGINQQVAATEHWTRKEERRGSFGYLIRQSNRQRLRSANELDTQGW